MIVKMKKYVFLVYHRQYTDFLEKLRDVGVVHVAEKPEGIAENDQLREKMQLAAKVKKTIAETESLLLPDTTPADASATIDGAALLQAFDEMQAEKQRLQQAITNTRKEAERMAVWGNYDTKRLQELDEAGYKLQFYACTESKFKPEWETEYNTFVTGKIAATLYFVVVSDGQSAPDIDAETITLNAKNSAQLLLDVEGLNHLLVAHTAKMQAWAIANYKNLQQYALQIEENIDFQKVELSTEPTAENKVMLLEGYCPQSVEKDLDTMLEQENIYYEVSDPVMGENVPIKLKNNFFAKLFEPITKLYALPNYSEIDPTPFFAPFFMLFFGLCLGDGGYGLLILIAATILRIKKPAFRNLAILGQFLGGATMVVGLLTGVFFGIMLDSVTWPWLAGVKEYFITSNNYADKLGGYDPMMLVAIGVGVLQILFAMGFNAAKITIQRIQIRAVHSELVSRHPERDGRVPAAARGCNHSAGCPVCHCRLVRRDYPVLQLARQEHFRQLRFRVVGHIQHGQRPVGRRAVIHPSVRIGTGRRYPWQRVQHAGNRPDCRHVGLYPLAAHAADSADRTFAEFHSVHYQFHRAPAASDVRGIL